MTILGIFFQAMGTAMLLIERFVCVKRVLLFLAAVWYTVVFGVYVHWSQNTISDSATCGLDTEGIDYQYDYGFGLAVAASIFTFAQFFLSFAKSNQYQAV